MMNLLLRLLVVLTIISGTSAINLLPAGTEAPAQHGQNERAWIAVRFEPGQSHRVRDGRLTGGEAGTMTVLDQLLTDTDHVWVRPYATGEDDLAALARTAGRAGTRRIPDPNLRYSLGVDAGTDVEALGVALAALEFVTYALPFPEPAPPPGWFGAVPDLVPAQGYLSPGADGVGATQVWATQGVRGEGVRVVDIEYDFNAGHQDLPQVPVLGGIPHTEFGDDHGTAVLGQIGALDNDFGVTGIAPDAGLYFHFAHTAAGVYDVGAAVVDSLDTLDPGDVILIEQQIPGPNADGKTQDGLVPVEWFRPWYEDIVLAVEYGAVVVMAAGNGGEDLDDSVYAVGNGGHFPFLPENDSGAIVVGAGAAPPHYGGSDAARARLPFSNFGSRVTLQGWGEQVATTGYGEAYDAQGPDWYFTDIFGGTSSAAPVVAGAAALLQSVALARTGEVLGPHEIRAILEATGTPQQPGQRPLSEHIGPLPDVHAALIELDLQIDHIFRDRFETCVVGSYCGK